MDAVDTDTEEPPGTTAAHVDILDLHALVPAAARAWLADRAGAALARLGAGGEVRVRIVPDTEMAAAHVRYCNDPGTTDVLTFDLREDPSAGGPLDVDVLVCADEARRQAASRGGAVERELLLYVVHAVLHCLGEDDHDEAGARRMHEREDATLAAIGVGPVFAVPARGEAGT
jgi:probable rRNA maturation factor